MPPPKKKAKLKRGPKTQKLSSPQKNSQKPSTPAPQQTQTQIANIYGYHELTQNPNWAKGLVNPLLTTQTFVEALRVTDSVKNRLQKLAPTLPRRGPAMYRPTTLSEATSYVNAREDAKKKQGVARLGGDVVAVPAESYRGSHPGVVEGDGDAAAFWLYTSDFFRDFCVEDAVELLAFLKSVEEVTEFRLAEVRARPPELLQNVEVENESIVGLLDKPVIQPQRRQRRDSQKSQRAAGYVFSMPSISETADDIALAQALSQSVSEHAVAQSTAKQETEATPVTLNIPKAKLNKLNKVLGSLKKIVKAADAVQPTNAMHPWTRQLLHETKIPNHIVHAATEPYYLDPPGSLTQENLANLVKHTEKVTEEVNKFIHQSSYASNEQAIEVMATAPQDELAAESLALQSELAAVMASNRARMLGPLNELLKDIVVQDKKRKEREEDEAFATKFFNKMAKMGSTKLPSGVLTGVSSGIIHNPNNPVGAPHPAHVGNGASEEAFCAVCSDGFSAPPNVILFCDRCDVPVHQQCYNVEEIPQHEWLCWPCREHEDELIRQGKTREEIRPASLSLEHRSQLPGGSKDVSCALCPIKGGAFRKTIDGKHWVHQACAMWHPEVSLRKANECAVVMNLEKIPDERLNNKCSICGQAQGAIIKCPKLGCANKYHVVCAKNCGLYFSTGGTGRGSKIFCINHSAAEQEKDSVLLAKRLAGVTPKMTKASQRRAQEEIRKRDLIELQRLESELCRMQALRVNLEQVRQLLDLCKRREKVKKSYAVAVQDAYKMERVKDPAGALDLLERINSHPTPTQALAEVFGVSTVVNPMMGLDTTSSSLQVTPDGSIKMADGTALYTLVDERVSKAGRPRRVAGMMERELVMTINDAEILNGSLPQGVRYVRSDTHL